MTRRLLLLLPLLLLPSWAEGSPTCSLKTSDFTNTDATSFNTASVTLQANHLYLLYAVTKVASGTANTATASSTGATWVAIDNQAFNVEKIVVLRTMVTSDKTGAVTIDYAGQTQTAQLWTMVDCSPVDTSGTNGSGAVVTSNKNSVISGTSLTCTFASYSSTSNRPVVGFGGSHNNVFDTIQWTNINGDNTGPDAADIQVSWRDATDQTTVTDGFNTSANIACIGVEVKAASGAVQRKTLSPLGTHTGGRQGQEDY